MIKADASIHGEIRPAGVVSGSAQSGAEVDGDIRQTLLKGEKGDKGDTPVITAKRSDHVITIYVDGAEIAKLTDGEDGNTPIITAERSGADVTVYVDGTVIATLHDGVKGDKGDSYILTQADKEEIVGMVDIPEVPVQDVQIIGKSILNEGVANIPFAGANTVGVVKINSGYGININQNNGGYLFLNPANDAELKTGTMAYKAVTPYKQHKSVFYGLAKAAGHDEKDSTLAVGTYSEEAKSAISEMLGGSVAVSGTSPAINAKTGVRYVCGEVSTLDITLPTSGIVDVVFTSGSTPTALTINGSVRWANGFDSENLDADTTYEINIMDGLGVAASWT